MTAWTDDENGGTVWSDDEGGVLTDATLVNHITNTSNPHSVTASQLSDLASSSGASLVGFAQSGSGSGSSRSVQTELRELCVNVKSGPFGAISGDNSANGTINKTAFANALATLTAAGGGTLLIPYGIYHFGNRSLDEILMDLDTPANIRVLSQHALLRMNTTDNSRPRFFRCKNPDGLIFDGIRFDDTGSDITVDWRGAVCLEFWGSGSAGFHGGIEIRNCLADDVVTFLDCNGTTDHRIRDIWLSNCRVRDSYYGINCRENGDGIRGSLRCENVRRAYFPYGVTDHNLEISIYHNGVGVGANSACLIKRYARDTKNIKLSTRFFGSAAQYNTAVTLEHEPAVTGTGVIEDIDLDIKISGDIASANAMTPLRFRSFDSGGSLETTTTNRWDNISLRGNPGAFGVGGNAIVFNAIQSTEGKLNIDPSWFKAVETDIPHYPGFVVRIGHDREFRTLEGNLTAQTVTIPLSFLDARAFALKMRVYAHDDSTALSAQDMTYQEDIIVGYNASGAGVTIQSTTNALKVTRTSDATIAYAASGENIVVSFAGAAYNTATGYARVETEFISRGPMYAT
jgi:hypothetical protein